MRPRPQQIQNSAIRPPNGVQSRGTSPATNQLPRTTAPPVPPATTHAGHVSDDDEEYGGPEFFADEMGNYLSSEVKDVRMQGLDADVLKRDQGGAAVHETTARTPGRTFSRSASFGPTSQAGSSVQLNPQNTSRPSINPPPRPPTGSQAFRPRAQKPFTRVHSDGGENARRAAIQGVFSASQQQHESQGVRAPVMMASQQGVMRNVPPQLSAGTAGAAVPRPSVGAGVTRDEIEALRQQVAQVRVVIDTGVLF